MSRAATRRLLTASAAWLGLLGAALLFAPQELGPLLLPGTASGPVLQLLGSALLGFALLCWMSRGSLLGGIYSRPVVAATQAHYLIGALVLLRNAAGSPPTPGQWAVTACYVLGAALFSILLFGPGPAADKS